MHEELLFLEGLQGVAKALIVDLQGVAQALARAWPSGVADPVPDPGAEKAR